MFIALSVLLAAACLVPATAKLRSHPKMLAAASHLGIPWAQYRLIGVIELAAATGVVMVVGGLAVAWPGVTVFALVVVFAVFAFMSAGIQARQAFSSRSAGPVVGHLLLGLVDVAAGLVALAWPAPTALVLVLVVASWAIVTGALEIAAAFRRGEEAGTRAMFILGGLVSVAFGVVLFARPAMGAISLALVFGLFNLISGSSMLVRGVELRRTNARLHALAPQTKTKAAA